MGHGFINFNYANLKGIYTDHMITRAEILMGRDKEFPLNIELEKNLERLLDSINKFRKFYGRPMIVSSGYRPGYYNKAAGGAKSSNHMFCLACDFVDKDSSIDRFCTKNTDILRRCGLYIEHPRWTKGWCHMQVSIPASKRRIFIPYSEEPSPDKHDEMFD